MSRTGFSIRKRCLDGVAVGLVAAGLAAVPCRAPLAQPVGLPSMGVASAAELSPELERTLGDAIMEQGRRDPAYISDPDVLQYLTDMGRRLAAQADTASAERINVFALRDPQINAFALPGGYIGVNSGLVVAAGSESELASVVAHEISHVLQRHIARGMTQQAQTNYAVIAALAGALLAALSGSADLAMGVAAFGQAAAIDRQLGFSRQAEQEADRSGLEMMVRAGYDPAGMARMFERLENAARLNERTGGNVYTSTHPLSMQRLSDAQNRSMRLPHRAGADSDAFWYVRAKLRVEQARAGQALRQAEEVLRADVRQSSGVQKSAAWYGLAYAAWKRRDLAGAEQALGQARAEGHDSPQIAGLDVALALARGDADKALRLSQQAVQRWPGSQGIALAQIEALLGAGRHEEAVRVLQKRIDQWPELPRLWQLLGQTQERLKRPAAARRAMATYYELTGALPAAVEQLQQARAMSRDFYEQSELDVRIRQLRERLESDRALLERFKR